MCYSTGLIMYGDFVVEISEGLYTLKRPYSSPRSHLMNVSVTEICVQPGIGQIITNRCTAYPISRK